MLALDLMEGDTPALTASTVENIRVQCSICALDETEIVMVVMGEQQGDYRLLSSVRRVCNGNPISIVGQLSRF